MSLDETSERQAMRKTDIKKGLEGLANTYQTGKVLEEQPFFHQDEHFQVQCHLMPCYTSC